MTRINFVLSRVEYEKSFMTSRPGLKAIKLFSCSTQLSRTFILLINAKMPTMLTLSKPFDTLIVFLKEFFEKVDFKNRQQTTTKA